MSGTVDAGTAVPGPPPGAGLSGELSGLPSGDLYGVPAAGQPADGSDVSGAVGAEVERRQSEVFASRGLGGAMALAAADPANLVHAAFPLEAGLVRVVLLALMALGAWFAAPPVVARPVNGDPRWASKLSRHRNTVLAVGFVVAVAIGDPAGWMMVCDAGLLLAYLLFVDAAAGGPPGAAQLRDWPVLLAAVAAQGLVLTGALVSVATADSWARGTAALLILAVCVGLLVALRRRRGR